jgi:hypothetical protein
MKTDKNQRTVTNSSTANPRKSVTSVVESNALGNFLTTDYADKTDGLDK